MMLERFKLVILSLVILVISACGMMGAAMGDLEDESEQAGLSGGTATIGLIDLDGDVVELDESYSVEVGGVTGSDFGGSATQSPGDRKNPSETDLENPDTATVGMLPTPAKQDEECFTEGETQVSVRSIDSGESGPTAFLAAAPASYRLSRRFFTSTDFITSLKVTDTKQFETLEDEQAEVNLDALICEEDEDGDLIWTSMKPAEIAATHEVAFGFVDENNQFLDKNLVLEDIGASGSVFVPKEYLALQDGEQAYVSVVQKNTRVMQNSGAVILSNINSKMTVTFPPSISVHFGSK